MYKLLLPFLISLFFLTSLNAQETFRRTYGLTNPYANERAHRIESAGANGVIIGFSDSPVTNQPELTYWTFDTITGLPIDSMVLFGFADDRPIPDGGFIHNSYPAPNDGFLLVTQAGINSAGFRNLWLTVFDASMAISWSSIFDLSTHDHVAYAFNSAGELLCLQSERSATGNVPFYRITRLNTDGSETPLFDLAELSSIYSFHGLDVLPSGDLLVSGGENGSSYLSRYTPSGTRTNTYVAQLFSGSFPSERLTAAQLLADGQTIMATGVPFSGPGRSFLTLDANTFTPQWDTIHTGVFGSFEREKIEWFADGFFVEDYQRSNFNSRSNSTLVKFSTNGYSPRLVDELNFNTSSASATDYNRDLNARFTTVNDFSVIGDENFELIGFLPPALAPMNFVSRFGKRGYSSNEVAVGLLPGTTQDEFALLYVGPRDSTGRFNEMMRINTINNGDSVNVFNFGDTTTQASELGGVQLADGNYFVAYRDVLGRLLLDKYSPQGSLIWENIYPLGNGFSIANGIPLGALSDGSLLVTDNPYDLNVFDFRSTVAKLDANGFLVDSVEHFDFYLGSPLQLLVDDQDKIFVAGNGDFNFTTTRIRKLNSALNTEWVQDINGRFVRMIDYNNKSLLILSDSNDELIIQQRGEDGQLEQSTGPLSQFRSTTSGAMFASAGGNILFSVFAQVDSLPTIALLSYDPITSNAVVLNTFSVPHELATVVGLRELDDGRIAIYGTVNGAFVGSTNHYLIVTDAEGNVTSTSGAFMLPGELTVYPVPSAGILNIKLEGFEANELTLELYDLTGRLLESQRIDAVDNLSSVSTVIELSNYSSGTYFLRIHDGLGRMLVRKVTKL